MRATQVVLAALIIFATACTGTDESSSQRNLEEEGDCGCKIEGSLIGQEWVLVRFGSKGVAVHDWVEKAGSNGEYVGFTLTTNASSIRYAVKASGEVYPSTARTWMHPNGADGGSSSPGISNVDFCDNCPGGDCDGDGGCDDPDGCPDGGGGGGGDGGGGGGGDDGGCDNPDGCEGGGDGGPILL